MKNLLSPLEFSGLHLRNRIVMPPMWSGGATAEGCVTDQIIEYHRVRAAAGCGLVIVEHTFVHSNGRHSTNQLGVHSDAMIEGLSRLAGAVRAEGAAICLQLAHAGSRGNSSVLGCMPVGPSAIRHPYEKKGEIPSALTKEQIGQVVKAFGDAAVRARTAGFDAVEIHGAHGFLLSEFLSPLTNQRVDEYGGTLQERVRIHLEVAAEIRRRIGAEPPLFIRLGVDDETPGGVELEEACKVGVWLADAGIDLIDISGGLQGSRGIGKGPGYFVAHGEAMKSCVKVPVLVTGGIAEPVFADRLIREGRADLIGVGRAMLDDPQWARKAMETLSAGK